MVGSDTCVWWVGAGGDFRDGCRQGGSVGKPVSDGKLCNFNGCKSPASVFWAKSPFVCAQPNETCDDKGVK